MTTSSSSNLSPKAAEYVSENARYERELRANVVAMERSEHTWQEYLSALWDDLTYDERAEVSDAGL